MCCGQPSQEQTYPLFYRHAVLHLAPPEPPELRPALEFHQPAPLADPKAAWEQILEQLEALYRYHSSVLASVLVSPPAPVTDDFANSGEALARAVDVVRESLSAKPE
jgi:hypothetical protein